MTIIILGVVFLAFAPSDASAGTFGKRAGVWLAMSQTNGGGAGGDNFPSAQQFVNAYFNTGNVFSTAMFYVQVSNPDELTRTLQIASLVDSNPNIKLSIVMGYAFDSLTDWATAQSFMVQLKLHPSIGWVGIEGEHSTYGTGSSGGAGCEFGGNCYSLGQASAYHTLSESQMEGYFAQFSSMAATAGLSVVHYYITFGTDSWKSAQPQVVVTQWPVCNGSAPCAPLSTGIGDLSLCTSANCLGISGGLSSNDYDGWNPNVNSGSYYESWDNVINAYIQAAAQYPDSARSLVIFETGAYQFIDDWYRPVFVSDLARAMAQYPSNWVLPGSAPFTQTTTTIASGTTTSDSRTSTVVTASTTSIVTTSRTSIATTSISVPRTTSTTVIIPPPATTTHTTTPVTTGETTWSTSTVAQTSATSHVTSTTTEESTSTSSSSSTTVSSSDQCKGDGGGDGSCHHHGDNQPNQNAQDSPISSTLGLGRVWLTVIPLVVVVLFLCVSISLGRRLGFSWKGSSKQS